MIFIYCASKIAFHVLLLIFSDTGYRRLGKEKHVHRVTMEMNEKE